MKLSSGKLVAFLRVGASIPAYATAVGSALLAALPDSDIENTGKTNCTPYQQHHQSGSPAGSPKSGAGLCTDNEETLVGIACEGPRYLTVREGSWPP